jgi:nicotinamidase-related amidase
MTKSLRLSSAKAVLLALIALPILATTAPAETVIDQWASVKTPPAPQLKPVTVDPKTTALLLLDFLPGPYCSSKPHCVASLPAMKKLLADARSSGAAVIYSVAGNFNAPDILKDIAPGANEPTVKSKADKFLNTNLEKILTDKGIKTVIVTGTAANGAVLYTASGAAMRGLNAIIPVDGLSSSDPYAEQLTVWQLSNGPGFGAQVTVTRSDMIKF